MKITDCLGKSKLFRFQKTGVTHRWRLFCVNTLYSGLTPLSVELTVTVPLYSLLNNVNVHSCCHIFFYILLWTWPKKWKNNRKKKKKGGWSCGTLLMFLLRSIYFRDSFSPVSFKFLFPVSQLTNASPFLWSFQLFQHVNT